MTRQRRARVAAGAIARRDFLNGVALGTAGLVAGPRLRYGLAESERYPPALTGMRGSHDGSYAVAHNLKDGAFWKTAGTPESTGEHYDLVVVGGGISGLAAAYFWRQAAGPGARILILDNHDDFGGHAKRNEFHQSGPMRLAHGGTFAIDSPAPYSAFAKDFIADLGIDVSSWSRVTDAKLYSSLGLGRGIFFDKETFGRDALTPNPLRGEDRQPGAERDTRWRGFARTAPLSARAKADLERLLFHPPDFLPGLSSSEKKARLARVSYADYLTGTAKVSGEIVRLLQTMPHSLYGVGIDGVSAQDAWGLGYPGFAGLRLDPTPGPGMNRDAIPSTDAEGYFFHFPDGNSSVARLLVRRLVPTAVPGSSATDVVTARTDYARLDEPSGKVRIRLDSTAVRVLHVGDPGTAREVEVTYLRNGRLRSVRARSCILACWHSAIPHLCPEIGAEQREALAYAVKVPIVYTSVLLRDWSAFQKVGYSAFYAPGGYHSTFDLTIPVALGSFKSPRQPRESIALHMTRTPCSPGLPARDQHRVGRQDLLNTPFDRFEREIKDQLERTLRPGGFDPGRDILAITVNRWPHGYAYQYNSLFDSFWLEGGPTPCSVARRPFGRVAIANADSEAYSYTDAALDSAARAVHEVRSRT
jgi:spermidine dehydrogenase